MKTLSNAGHAAASDEYLELIRAFPLRALRTQAEHDEAVKILARLLGRPDGRLSSGERDYAEVLDRMRVELLALCAGAR